MGRLPTKREMRDFAMWLHEVHAPDGGTRCDPTWKREYKGLLVQWRFAFNTGGEVDMERKRRGDGHIDAIVDMVGDGDEHPPGEYAVDCKAAVNPTCLMVAKRDMDKIERPTVFVLGGITNGNDEDWIKWDAELLGWQWDSALRNASLGDRGGYGIVSYYLDDQGRDIYELLAKINRKWGRGA